MKSPMEYILSIFDSKTHNRKPGARYCEKWRKQNEMHRNLLILIDALNHKLETNKGKRLIEAIRGKQ